MSGLQKQRAADHGTAGERNRHDGLSPHRSYGMPGLLRLQASLARTADDCAAGEHIRHDGLSPRRSRRMSGLLELQAADNCPAGDHLRHDGMALHRSRKVSGPLELRALSARTADYPAREPMQHDDAALHRSCKGHCGSPPAGTNFAPAIRRLTGFHRAKRRPGVDRVASLTVPSAPRASKPATDASGTMAGRCHAREDFAPAEGGLVGGRPRRGRKAQQRT